MTSAAEKWVDKTGPCKYTPCQPLGGQNHPAEEINHGRWSPVWVSSKWYVSSVSTSTTDPPDLDGSEQENRARACVDQAHTVTWSLWAEGKEREKTRKLPYNAEMTSDTQGMLCWFLVPIKTNNHRLFQFKTTRSISRSSAGQKSCQANMKGGVDPVPSASFGFLALLWFVDPLTILHA